MTKRALIIGCTGGGLPECAADARLAAHYLSMPPFLFDCHIVIDDVITLDRWIGESLWLHGADVALPLYSGHGFRGKRNGKVITGIWSGVPITHALFEQSVLQPLRRETGTVVRIYDCCYAGGARTAEKTAPQGYKSGAAPDFVSQDPKHNRAAQIKCYTELTDADQPPARLEHYQSVNERDIVVAACGARQFSYGELCGAPGTPWSCVDTKGHSLFSWALWPSLWHRAGALRAGVQSAQWRCNHLLEAFALDSKWRMAPGVKYPLPDVQLALPSKSLNNILTAK